MFGFCHSRYLPPLQLNVCPLSIQVFVLMRMIEIDHKSLLLQDLDGQSIILFMSVYVSFFLTTSSMLHGSFMLKSLPVIQGVVVFVLVMMTLNHQNSPMLHDSSDQWFSWVSFLKWVDHLISHQQVVVYLQEKSSQISHISGK